LYRSHSATGASWATPTSIIATPATTLPHCIALKSANVISIFYLSGAQLYEIQITWNASTHAVTSTIITPSRALPANVVMPTYIDGVWDATRSVWHIVYAATTTTSALHNIFLNAFSDGTASVAPTVQWAAYPVISTYAAVNVGGLGVSASKRLRILLSGAKIYLTYGSDSGTGTILLPITVGTSSYAVGVPEVAYAVGCEHTSEFDINGNVDLVLFDPSGSGYGVQGSAGVWSGGSTNQPSVVTRKRSGNNLYSSISSLYGNTVTTTVHPGTAYNAATGDLYVFHEVTAFQSNGEIYEEARASGLLIAAQNIAGGDAGGYSHVSVAKNTDSSGNAAILYVTGIAAPYSLYFYKVTGTGSVPSTPVNTAPANAAATSTTPSFAWTYGNPVASDVQLAYDLRVTRVSDSVVMWRSGKVTSALSSGIVYGAVSNTGDGNYVAPATLVTGIQYNFQIITYDTAKNLASPLSAATTFTPAAAPTTAVTAIITAPDGTLSSSPSAITTNVLDIQFTYTQTSGNAGDQWQWTLYDVTGTTQIAQSAWIPLAMASGNTYTSADQTISQFITATNYQLVVTVRDGTTLLTGASAQWQINVAFAPPGIATGLTVVNQDDLGYMQLAWTNGANTASVNVLTRPSGTSAWVTIPAPAGAAQPLTSLKVFAYVNQSYDYGIQTVSALGATAAITIYTNTKLGLKAGGMCGHWYNLSTDPLGTSVAFGGVVDWTSVSQWTHVEDAARALPQGRSEPITSYGLADFWTAIGRKYWIPQNDLWSTPTLASTVLATIQKISLSHVEALHRDPTGNYRYVLVENFQPEVADAFHSVITMDLHGSGNTILPVILSAL